MWKEAHVVEEASSLAMSKTHKQQDSEPPKGYNVNGGEDE